MKFLLLFLGLGLTAPAPSLLLVDMDGKRPPLAAESFSLSQYVSRSFPIYAADRGALIAATVKAAHLLDAKRDCGQMDTVHANHTTLIVKSYCEDGATATVRYITHIEELRFVCDFELIRKEGDRRKAQRRLLDFADYLAR